jgi:hypothetical protein
LRETVEREDLTYGNGHPSRIFSPRREYLDSYKDMIEALIQSNMKGEKAIVKENRPKKGVAKGMMEDLREILK